MFPKNRVNIVLGVLVALMPALGFPRAWESRAQVVLGLLIVFLSMWATVDKRLSLKAKAQKRQASRKREAEIVASMEPEGINREEERV